MEFRRVLFRSLYVKIGEPDNGVVHRRVPKPLRQLIILGALTLAALLVTGTLVTGAGPHAGDKSISQPVPRLQVQITTLVPLHSSLLVAYLSLDQKSVLQRKNDLVRFSLC